jgi:hypothetical protein
VVDYKLGLSKNATLASPTSLQFKTFCKFGTLVFRDALDWNTLLIGLYFINKTKRIEFMFELYNKHTAGLFAKTKSKNDGKRTI